MKCLLFNRFLYFYLLHLKKKELADEDDKHSTILQE